MDQTPEPLDQIQREAEGIDPYQYRRRQRRMAAIAVGALGAGLVWGVLALMDSRRNPCERVRNHFCTSAPGSVECKTASGVFLESVEDDSPKMRSLIRAQCEIRIKRLKDEEGIKVR
jgi:hypothetical protein